MGASYTRSACWFDLFLVLRYERLRLGAMDFGDLLRKF